MPVKLTAAVFAMALVSAGSMVGSAHADENPICPGMTRYYLDKLSKIGSYEDKASFRDNLDGKCPTLAKIISADLNDHPPPLPPPTYANSLFTFELQNCTRKGKGAECQATITPKRNFSFGAYSWQTYLADDAGKIPLTWMSVGGHGYPIGQDIKAPDEDLAANITTPVILRFDGPVEPKKVQALVVPFATNHGAVPLKGIPWQ